MAARSNDDLSSAKGQTQPCRACTDFKTWAKAQEKGKETDSVVNTPAQVEHESVDKKKECPLDINQLGRNTWGFMHTMAAYYPDNPSSEQQRNMSTFLGLFSKFYPCDHCAEDLRDSLKKSKPKTSSRWELSQWMCQMHNEVNVKLGKSKFDCGRVDERWRDGWKDGSCD